MVKLFLQIALLFFLKSSTTFAQPEARNISIRLKENRLTAGQTFSMVINPGSALPAPVFLYLSIIDQSFSVVHQQIMLFNQATEYKWLLPAELNKGLYIATVTVDNNEGTETVGLPFSYLRTDIKIPRSSVLLPVQLDTIFYGFNLRFKTNISSSKPIYYTLQTKDSLKRTGFIQADSTGIIEIGGNNFYESGDIVFSLLDTCNGCKIEPYTLATNIMNTDYLTAIFKQADSTIIVNNNGESEFKGNLPNVVVRTRVKSRKELYETNYVKNFMFKSPMSKDFVVDDDPFAVNYNNNLFWYLIRIFPGLYLKNNELLYRFGSVDIVVDESIGIPAPNYIDEIAYIKFIPQPMRGLNSAGGNARSLNSMDNKQTGGFFGGGNAFAGTTATIAIYTKRNFDKPFIPKKTISLQVQGAMDATSAHSSTISNQ